MKNITDIICENAVIKGLKPVLYFTSMDFFETVTNPEEQKHLTAMYKRVDNNHFIYFYFKQKQIGYLKLFQPSAW